jgi:hypothetical protein
MSLISAGSISLDSTFKHCIPKPQDWEISRLWPENSTKLYVHEFGFRVHCRKKICGTYIMLQKFLGIKLNYAVLYSDIWSQCVYVKYSWQFARPFIGGIFRQIRRGLRGEETKLLPLSMGRVGDRKGGGGRGCRGMGGGPPVKLVDKQQKELHLSSGGIDNHSTHESRGKCLHLEPFSAWYY